MHEDIFSKVKYLYSFHENLNKIPSDLNTPTKK